MGGIKQSQNKNLRNQIMEHYEHVGGEKNEKGEWLNEGKNWLNGLSGNLKENIALLYENQAEYIKESTDTASAGSFEVIAFPMIRRTYARLLLNDIATVRAMSHPAGELFFFYPNVSDRVMGTDGDGRVTGSHTSPFSKNLAACLGANCPDTTYHECRSLYDHFYNERLYDRSRGKFTIITATGETVTLNTETGCYAAGSAQLAYDGTYREVGFGVTGFDGSNPGTRSGHTARLNGPVGLEIDTDDFLASFSVINVGDPILDPDGRVIYETGDEVKYRIPAQKYASSLVEYSDWCDANGTLYVKLDLTDPTPMNDTISRDGYVGAATGTTFASDQFAFAWRRYEDFEYETEMGEVTFTLEKVTISVTDHQLRARWTPQVTQDVAAYHNIDAEAELTQLLSEQMAMEIDRKGLREMKRGAAWKKRWNYLGWRNTGAQKYTQKEWNQTLVTAINQISAQIHKSTLRGGATFIVVSSEVSALLDDMDNFMASNAEPGQDTYNLGMQRVGTLASRYTVYVDPYARANDILVGYKGTGQLDVGYAYMPYVAAQLTPTLTDTNNFTNVKGIMTRAASKMVNNRMYGTVFVDFIPTFDVNELR